MILTPKVLSLLKKIKDSFGWVPNPSTPILFFAVSGGSDQSGRQKNSPLLPQSIFTDFFCCTVNTIPPKMTFWSKEIFYSCGRRFVVSRFRALSGLIIRSALLGYKFQFSPNLGHFQCRNNFSDNIRVFISRQLYST